jgi:hypothetical protein
MGDQSDSDADVNGLDWGRVGASPKSQVDGHDELENVKLDANDVGGFRIG